MNSWVVVVQCLPLCFLQLQRGLHTEHEGLPRVVLCADLGFKLMGGIECFCYSYQSK